MRPPRRLLSAALLPLLALLVGGSTPGDQAAAAKMFISELMVRVDNSSGTFQVRELTIVQEGTSNIQTQYSLNTSMIGCDYQNWCLDVGDNNNPNALNIDDDVTYRIYIDGTETYMRYRASHTSPSCSQSYDSWVRFNTTTGTWSVTSKSPCVSISFLADS
jgi:hypothetical protein